MTLAKVYLKLRIARVLNEEQAGIHHQIQMQSRSSGNNLMHGSMLTEQAINDLKSKISSLESMLSLTQFTSYAPMAVNTGKLSNI